VDHNTTAMFNGESTRPLLLFVMAGLDPANQAGDTRKQRHLERNPFPMRV